MSASISVKTRKRLWLRSGGSCAFTGCEETLLEAIDEEDDTVVGVECHIIAKEDAPDRVARSISALSPKEGEKYRNLIARRHSFPNLVLMCPRHARVIDDPDAGYDVKRVVKMKRLHERRVADSITPDSQLAGDLVLQNAEIVDGWVKRAELDEWPVSMGYLIGDGHPRMRKKTFDRLTDLRHWMFRRAWPGTEPALEQAFDNFRWVAQDLQLVLMQYPHEVLARQGWVAPLRFYNDPQWRRQIQSNMRLDGMYEWYAGLLADLGLELTRAANLTCQAVREAIDPRFRLEQGLVVLNSGPYEDFTYRTHRPRYSPTDGWSPYAGIRDFIEAREERDEHLGSGSCPEGLRLPGDSFFD